MMLAVAMTSRASAMAEMTESQDAHEADAGSVGQLSPRRRGITNTTLLSTDHVLDLGIMQPAEDGQISPSGNAERGRHPLRLEAGNQKFASCSHQITASSSIGSLRRILS